MISSSSSSAGSARVLTMLTWSQNSSSLKQSLKCDHRKHNLRTTATKRTLKNANKSQEMASPHEVSVALGMLVLVGALYLSTSVVVVAATKSEQQLEQQATEINASNQSISAVKAFGDLIAAGRVSIANQQDILAVAGGSHAPWRHDRGVARPSSGRLVDRIAETSQVQSVQPPNTNKLDYIIDFLKQNKLTKFCDLLTQPDGRIKLLIRQLNELDKFTLFVPTNEALLLMPSAHLAALQSSPDELRHFLMAHVTNELIVPKLTGSLLESSSQLQSKYSPTGTQNHWSSGRAYERIVQGAPSTVNQDDFAPVGSSASSTTSRTSTIYSLAGSPLRLITTPVTSPQVTGSGDSSITRLELIVNGANVLSGHSHALQEPNNTQATYAIVHLIDRTLYPVPTMNLYDKIRTLAPRFAKLIQASQDLQLIEQLKSAGTTGQLVTAFVPTDDAFRHVVQTKLLDQLDSNRTYLQHFLRSHFADGLYFSGQLAGIVQPSSNRTAASVPRRLSSLAAGVELEFGTKMVQSRQLIVINSMAPLLEHDQMALNGVVHLISRPIFERHLLDVACNCESKLAELPAVTSNELLQFQPQSPPQPQANWFRNEVSRVGGSELEREESQSSASRSSDSTGPGVSQQLAKIVRSQRSDTLIARNNRDFYRPSTAPVDLLLAPDGGGDSSSGTGSGVDQLIGPLESNNSLAVIIPPALSELERYKIVLNATTRQKLREQQLAGSGELGADNNRRMQFVYDRPLSSTARTPTSELLSYSRVGSSSSQDPLTNRNNNLTSSDQVNSSASTQRQQRLLLKFQAEDARDLPPPAGGKKLALAQPPGGATSFNGCAFYDADCKRALVGKLVRLPPTKSTISSSVQLTPNGPHVQLNHRSQQQQPTTPTPANAFDSTFGESTDAPLSFAATGNQRYTTPTMRASIKAVGPLPAGSSLNQPLPPWTGDEAHRIKSVAQQWRPNGELQSGDITRIQFSSSNQSTTSVNYSVPLHVQQSVLMVPVKLFQDTNISLANSRLTQQTHRLAPLPVYFGAPAGQRGQAAGSLRDALAPATFSASAHYFTPTIQPATPFRFSNQRPASSPGRLTNFTALETVPSEDQFDKPPRTSVKFATGSGSAELDSQSLRDAIKQARKIVRLQGAPPSINEYAGGLAPARGDISITSAKLSSPARQQANLIRTNSTSGGLATLASNQSPDAATFVAAAAAADETSGSTSADFFQNRTIGEIMEDSGLRIDGQQVTFNRVRECLERADLFNLISQAGSALTIFLPTDVAFQRLVQMQALMQQLNMPAGSATRSARLSDPSNRKYLVPLIARVTNTHRDVAAPTENQSASVGRLLASATELSVDSSTSAQPSSSQLANRLTLDCSSQQARQLLLDHLSAQLITPRQLQADLVLPTLSGKRLLLSSVPSKKIVVVDGQPVIAATRAKNGMVYVVNKFLNISQQAASVIELLDSQPQLKTFQSYLNFASLSDRLKRETGPLTILAPTNEAFEQLGSAARQLLNSDPSAMMDILRGHIIEGAQFGKLVSMRNRLKTMNSDHFIEAKVIKPNIYQLDNQMTSIKLLGTAGNGVLNSIDRLIVPPWLRVATGTSRARDSPESVLSDSTTGSRVNLPLLNNQPVSFEQPDVRLAPPSTSFGLQRSPSLDGVPTGSQFDESPFSRIATPAETSGSRLTFNSSSSGLMMRTNATTTTSTTLANNKNMQLIEKLAGLMRARKFVKFLTRSKLSSTLKQDMNYVLLVPTDQAIDRLPRQILDMLERDSDRLADLINFHVLDTTFEYINTIPDGQTLQTLNEKDILFNWHRNNTILTASGAVVLGGIQEENIALLIVDRVLYPTPGDLWSIVTKSPILSNFTNLIRTAQLEGQLSLAGPFTLFAPSDFAFNQLDRRDLEFLHKNRDTARRFLLRHLSQPAVFTSSIALSNATEPLTQRLRQPADSSTSGAPITVPLLTATNLLGEDLTLRQKNDYFSVNDVNFSYADVAATNGVVHVIDGLL